MGEQADRSWVWVTLPGTRGACPWVAGHPFGYQMTAQNSVWGPAAAGGGVLEVGKTGSKREDEGGGKKKAREREGKQSKEVKRKREENE